MSSLIRNLIFYDARIKYHNKINMINNKCNIITNSLIGRFSLSLLLRIQIYLKQKTVSLEGYKVDLEI